MTDLAPSTYSDDTRATQLVARFWHTYLKQHWRWLVAATLLMMAEGSTLGLLSYSLEPMFDRVLVGGDGSALYLIGGAIMALFLVRAIAGIGQRTILTRVAQISVTELQKDMVAHLMRLDSLYFHDHTPGALLERIQGDTNQIQHVWQVLIQGAARDFIALISLGIVATAIDPIWALTALIGIPALILPAAILQRYLRKKAGVLRDVSYDRSNRLSEIFAGIETVKLNRMEAYQNRRFGEIVAVIVRQMVKQAVSAALLPGLLDIMVGVGFFAVLVLGGQDILSGEKSVGQFMSFFTAMALAFQPLRRLANLAGILQTTAASLERIYAVLDTKPRITSLDKPVAAPEGNGVAFDNVFLSYGADAVLKGLSFSADEGKTTALVGPSGAGKSTVFRLIARLLEVDAGFVRLGGTVVNAMALEDLRDRISIVTQDAPMFDETIRENILLGRTDVSDDTLRQVIDDAQLAEFIDSVDGGLDARAGPRGANLSGGQRQRVAIARAFLRDSPVLLLDEATSALDAQAEAAIQKALARLRSGRTTIVIAHRLSTIRDADKIVVMNDGRAVDEGTHEELLANDGLYAALYKLQFAEGRS
ncbi:MAG: ABC transporter ATP-binding protein [Pseudomonadota bacterium]